MMKKVILNENGIKKLAPYLESRGLKFKVSGNKLVFDDYEFYVCAPVMVEEIPPPPGAAPVPQGIPDAGANDDPQAKKMPSQTEEPIGKNKNTQVKQVGRAGIQRQQQQEMQKMSQKLKSVFPTRAELDNFLKTITAQGDEDAISQLAQALQTAK
jgi:hypothetical protein